MTHAEIAQVHGKDAMPGDASLIAAAPDLLAALEKCCATMEANDADYYAGDIRAARAAIAKARGKS